MVPVTLMWPSYQPTWRTYGLPRPGVIARSYKWRLAAQADIFCAAAGLHARRRRIPGRVGSGGVRLVAGPARTRVTTAERRTGMA